MNWKYNPCLPGMEKNWEINELENLFPYLSSEEIGKMKKLIDSGVDINYFYVLFPPDLKMGRKSTIEPGLIFFQIR